MNDNKYVLPTIILLVIIVILQIVILTYRVEPEQPIISRSKPMKILGYDSFHDGVQLVRFGRLEIGKTICAYVSTKGEIDMECF